LPAVTFTTLEVQNSTHGSRRCLARYFRRLLRTDLRHVREVAGAAGV
jgi:hypothetical protein